MYKSIATILQARLRFEQFLGVGYIPKIILATSRIAHGESSTPRSSPAHREKSPIKNDADELVINETPAPIAQVKPIIHGDENHCASAMKIFATVENCQQCALGKSRRQVIFGEGNLSASVMLIGDAPGKDEEFLGRPYMGNAGELLTDIIEKGLQLSRREVFITTILKCRPPGNREATPAEIAQCLPFLSQQIALSKPRIIVAIGKFAGKILCASAPENAPLRGEWYEYNHIPVTTIYHPSFLLRQRRNHGKGNQYDRETWQDVQMIKARLNGG